MPAPTPPVPFKDHCSIIYDNTLYVYSPEAFQTLSLKDGAKWKEEANGVSVTGAVCAKGGVDGDNSKPALYVVGGTANESSPDYSGLQRYSIRDNSWETIDPVVRVTQHRHNHGVAYINASSTLLIYGGSQQDGYAGASSETFLMDTFPPYRVQAYSSLAPPTVKPYMLHWSEDRALMVGGSDWNQRVFTFGPADGWQDLGLALPAPLPEQPAAQAAVFTLDDGSRILQTFQLDQTPISVTINVLLNPGGQLASFNETVGQPTTITVSPSPVPTARVKRQTFLFNYPPYDPSNSPDTTRSGFSIAQGENGLVAFVGGDSDSSITFFNQTGNGWAQATALLGDQPQTTSSTRPISTATSLPTSSPTAAALSGGHSARHSMVILGGVLGGVCALAAILVIILLILRNIRRDKRRELEKERHSTTPDDKTWTDINFEEGGIQPLARQGQPMGRSPVTSIVGAPVESGQSTMLQPHPLGKNLIRRVSSDAMPKSQAAFEGRPSFTQSRLNREKNPPTISRPMNPFLGHFVRPSIDLGRATPASPIAPINATAMAAVPIPQRNRSQRKTDEAWARYFNGEKNDPTNPYVGHTRGKSRETQGAFWPGTGVPEKSTRSPKFAFRDSSGRPLQAQTVTMASPLLEQGPAGLKERNAVVSVGDYVSSDGAYEDVLDGAFSSGIPDSIHDAWSPMGRDSNSTGPRPKTEHSTDTNSSGIPVFPMPTPSTNSRNSGGPSLMSVENVNVPSIPGFNSATRRPPPPADYFGREAGEDVGPTDNDMSWLNLGTPQGQSYGQNR
jgi:hypothetical protein